MATKPYIKIIEQPAAKSCRFRYESEGRNSGSILGVNSTGDKQTYPTIEVGNFTGLVEIRISCVTNDDIKPKQHPHKLSTKDMQESGEVLLRKNVQQKKKIEIKDVGIVFVKKQRIEESLTLRMKRNIDPTKGGWDLISRPQLFDLHSVRLCFEAFIYKYNGNTIDKGSRESIGYVLSTPIMDKKSNGTLKIVDMSPRTSSVSGNEKVIILCDKVKREDISILFYEEDKNQQIIWKEEINYKNSKSMKVHHQYAISIRTPEYKGSEIGDTSNVFVKLIRPSDNETSQPFSFGYVISAQSVQLQRKKQAKVNDSVKKSLNLYADLLKKANKFKFATNFAENPSGSNRVNAVEHPPNQPMLINLAEENKENNTHMPLNNQLQNTYQAPVQPHHQRQTVNTYPYGGQYHGTETDSNYYMRPSYFYTPAAQHGHFGEPSNVQTLYNPNEILQPISFQQQKQQSQSTEYQNDQQHGGYMHQVTNSTANHSIPLTYNTDNSMNPNKNLDYFVNNAQALNDNPEENNTNVSDLVEHIQSSDLVKWKDVDGINENEMNSFANSFENMINL